MVTARFYNKNTKHLDFRFKLPFCSDYPHLSVHEFAQELSFRSDKSRVHYLAYAKDGKMVAREASYRGV